MIGRAAALAVVAVWLAAAAVSPAAAGDTSVFHSVDWGLSFRYPAALRLGTTFKSNAFDRGAWRISYAADTGPGTRIAAVALSDIAMSDAGGDGLATAELRFGASRDPDVVASCLTYGMNSGNNVEATTRVLGGVTFTEVPDNSDGETGRQIRTDDLRAVHGGACYAIDLVFFTSGTGNSVPSIPDSGIARLRAVLATIRFD